MFLLFETELFHGEQWRKRGEQTSTRVNCDEEWMIRKKDVIRGTGVESAEAENGEEKERELYPPPLLVVRTEK